MDLFIKLTAAALVSTVVCLVFRNNRSDTAVLISAAVCSMVILCTALYLQPVLDFCMKLQHIGKLDSNVLTILFKSVGIGLISQIVGMICSDSGNQTLAKAVNFAATAAVLWLALPLFEELLSLIDAILGAI